MVFMTPPNFVNEACFSTFSNLLHITDTYIKEVFEEPPLVAFKRNQNLKELLIRAKVMPNRMKKRRKLRGMKKCGKCVVCSFIKEGKSIKNKESLWTINEEYNCNTKNLVYMLECDKDNCKKTLYW